ncbi:MAG TPA: amidase family protein, partial [Gemmatimonadaceae bacterium]|nr:amidase family protein [Gemmatimonadaceae bacterium]
MSAVAHVRDAFARMAEVDAGPTGLNCILWTDEERALADAASVDAAATHGELAGVPFVAKDNIATTHLQTTCGSRILEGYVSPYEATVI